MPVAASVVVTEIMYDLPGSDEKREWVEILNEGPEADISVWRFFEGGVHHKLIPEGNATLPTGAYAVIADDAAAFRAEWPKFSGALFESSFSLSNVGETVAFKDSLGTIVASATYHVSSGAEGDGNSLNAESDSWRASAPTPGSPASASALSVPVPVLVSEDTSNPEPASEVISSESPKHTDSVTVSEEVSLAAAAAPVATPGSPRNPFAILPWITGLVAVIVIGIFAFLAGKNRSGYTIIEEKND